MNWEMLSSIFWKRSCTTGTNFSSNVRSHSSVQQSGPGDVFCGSGSTVLIYKLKILNIIKLFHIE